MMDTYHTLGDQSWRDSRYKVYGPLGIDLLLQASHTKPGIALVILVKLLPGVGDLVELHGGDREGADSSLAETGCGRLGAKKACERHLEMNMFLAK
jgi:hypothetical protein